MFCYCNLWQFHQYTLHFLAIQARAVPAANCRASPGLKNHHFKTCISQIYLRVCFDQLDQYLLVFCNAFLRSPPKPVLGSPTNMADSARASKRMRVVCLGRNPEKSLGSSSCGNQYDGRSRERICGCLIWRRFYPCKAAT